MIHKDGKFLEFEFDKLEDEKTNQNVQCNEENLSNGSYKGAKAKRTLVGLNLPLLMV